MADDIFARFAQLRRVSLSALCEGQRFRELDRKESYFRTTQDDHKQYTWEGMFSGYGGGSKYPGDVLVQPGFYVMHSQRRPLARYDLARVIVKRLSSFTFGEGHFPEIDGGDEETTAALRDIVEKSRLRPTLMDVRDLGGSEGTSCMSIGLVNGAPRFEAHNAKHCTVLSWSDRSTFVVGSVLKAYLFPRRVIDGDKVVTKDFFYARYWDEEVEIVWEPMLADIARSPNWSQQPAEVIRHGLGFCPFYWIQNIHDSVDPDGDSDYEGQHENLDEVNRLLSATSSGTRSSVDPTLVVRDQPINNPGTLRKGHENAIFSPGGAEYLELRGTSQQAAARVLQDLKQAIQDACGVVLVDPKEISGAAQSAAAMRIIYAPMLATVDKLREQYGEYAIRRPLLGMLRLLRKRAGEESDVLDETTGEIVRKRVALDIPRSGDKYALGEAESIKLKWPPYFAPTWPDIQAATTATQAANGGKPLITRKTATQAVAQLFGVTDVEEELKEMDKQAEEETQRQMDVMSASPRGPMPPGTEDKGE